MEVAPTSLFAVVAQDEHFFVSEVVWHRRSFDFIVKLSVLLPHIAKRLLTKWTLIFVLGKFFEAILMHRMSALKKYCRFLTREEVIVLANGTGMIK